MMVPCRPPWMPLPTVRKFLASAGQGAFSGSQIAGAFESYLPYAVAFGYTGRCFSAFEGICNISPTWFLPDGYSSGTTVDDCSRETGEQTGEKVNRIKK